MLLLMPAVLLAACASTPEPVKTAADQAAVDQTKAQEALAIGTEAYIYGYPVVTMEMTRRVMTNAVEPKDEHAPMGQFFNARAYPSPLPGHHCSEC